jgi:hypothetical protein
MNIVERLVSEKIVENPFHASGMLNVLECMGLENDNQRVERCKLYVEWKKYLENAKEFTNKKNAKIQARKNAIAGMVVPELPMLDETDREPNESDDDYAYQAIHQIGGGFIE